MYETCTTIPTFRIGYTYYVATYICKALYDNAQIQLQLQEYCLPLRCACMQCAGSLRKEGFLLATDIAHSTYIRIVCILSLLKMLATNTIKLTGLCMQELQCTYV